VLKRLEHYDLYLKPEKCDFEKEEIEYLSMIIKPGEVQMDPGKVAAVRDWPTPTILKEVQAL
jgi:anti-sigma28 factor (negative regulator of flagellin synthesis)